MTTLMLLDTSSLTYRAYFALPTSITDEDGHPVNAVRGVLDMHATLAGAHGPDEIVHVFDDQEIPDERAAAWPAYKAQRDAMPDDLAWQFRLLTEVLDVAGLPWCTARGWEADDAIATICAQAEAGTRIDVVTGDRDLIQLVRDSTVGGAAVRVLYTVKGVRELAVLDEDGVIERHGVPASRYIDYATMRGDSSDGLPGIKGVGEKTARDLVARYDSLDAIVAAAGAQTPALARRLREAAPYLEAMRAVVPCRTDVDVEWHRSELDAEEALELAQTHNLASPLARLLEALGAR